MKHYADNLGSNVAAMIKVRQVRCRVRGMQMFLSSEY